MQKSIIGAAVASTLASAASSAQTQAVDKARATIMDPPTDEQLEQQIQAKGLNAPRLTPEYIQAVIVDEIYTRIDGTNVTICTLTTANGHKVVGVNEGPVSAPNFDQEIGCELAYKHAVDQVWPLEGYLLRQRLHDLAASVERRARLAHEINRAYCEAIGDHSQKPWAEAEQWQRDSAIKGVEFALANPNAGPDAQHNAWMEAKFADGWTYGPTKDAEAKTHPCLVAYDALPREQRVKDYLFRAAVMNAAF